MAIEFIQFCAKQKEREEEGDFVLTELRTKRGDKQQSAVSNLGGFHRMLWKHSLQEMICEQAERSLPGDEKGRGNRRKTLQGEGTVHAQGWAGERGSVEEKLYVRN